MTNGFYSASQGVLTMQSAMDITANNIANVSTDGFKPLRASFSDLIYTVRNKKNDDVETGHGVKIDKTDRIFKISSLRNTGNALDFAIPSDGFFAVQRSDGTIAYTRDGAFSLGKTPDGTYQVCDDKGGKVLDAEGKPLTVTYNGDGTPDSAAISEKIGVYRFANPYGITSDGDNYYLSNESTGEAVADDKLDILSGYLENSTADLAEQMVNVIQYQRAYSLNIKMVQTADEIENVVNNLR